MDAMFRFGNGCGHPFEKAVFQDDRNTNLEERTAGDHQIYIQGLLKKKYKRPSIDLGHYYGVLLQ